MSHEVERDVTFTQKKVTNRSGKQSRQASFSKQRTNPGCSSGSAPHPKAPGRNHVRPQEEPGRVSRHPMGNKQRETQSKCNAPPWDNPQSKGMANHHYFVRRRRKRGVTRLWFNLMLLRETLQARLASPLQSISHPTRERLRDTAEVGTLEQKGQSR